MNLAQLHDPSDVAVTLRNELFIVASLLSTASDAADWKFQGRDVEAAALIYAARRKVDEVLAAIADALAEGDGVTKGGGA